MTIACSNVEISSAGMELVNSFAELALSPLSTLRKSARFSRFDATLGARRADHKPTYFIVKTVLRVLFTNLQLGLGEFVISCLEIEGLLFSSFDIAFAMSERGLRVWEKEVWCISLPSDSPTKYFTGSAVSVSRP
jgi:hypothetical protein